MNASNRGLALAAALLLPASALFAESAKTLLVPASAVSAKKVKLDLYVMSQCPFGVEAEKGFIPAARSLSGAVDLNLYFIAGEAPGDDGRPRFTSLHGPEEVKEDIRQLCAAKLAPAKLFDYLLERGKAFRAGDWRAAAQAAGLDAARIDACAGGPEGEKLFQENLKAHRARGANASPTIDIDGKPYTRARTQGWATVALCDALKEKGVSPPKACAEGATLAQTEQATGADGGCGGAPPVPSAPQGPAFDIRIVTEEACSLCKPTLKDNLAALHPTAKIAVLDSGSKEGSELLRKHQARSLPLYVLEAGVEKDQNFPRLLPVAYYKSGDEYLIRTGPNNYYPAVQLKRLRSSRHLDVFVESLSAQSAQAERDLVRFLLGEAKDVKDLTFSLHFLVEESIADKGAAPQPGVSGVRAASLAELGERTGALASARGDAEVREDLRQACLFQHAPIGAFFNYLSCRNQNLDDLRQADRCGRFDDAARKCVESGEGQRLLRQDARLARELEVTRAPVFLWENRYGPFAWNEADWRGLVLGGKEVALKATGGAPGN